MPYATYFTSRECRKVREPEIYTAVETKDIDYFLTIPMMSSGAGRKKLMMQREARLHFAAFVKSRVNDSEGGFVKGVLADTPSGGDDRIRLWVEDLKNYMTEYVKKTY